MKTYGFVYLTENIINGKKYIGQTTKPETMVYFGSGKIIRQAILKYGKKNFSRTVLAYADSKQELFHLERVLIAQFNAVEDENFYNISSGGNETRGFRGRTHSEETKAKMRLNGLTNHSHKGKKMSEQVRQNMSNAKKGISNVTEYQREVTRQTGLKNKGLKRSEEVKQKLRDAHQRRKDQGILKPSNKIWKIQTKDGIEETTCLSKWCKDKNLSLSAIQYAFTNNQAHKSGVSLISKIIGQKS